MSQLTSNQSLTCSRRTDGANGLELRLDAPFCRRAVKVLRNMKLALARITVVAHAPQLGPRADLSPVEKRPRVSFSSWRDIAMPCYPLRRNSGIAALKRVNQPSKLRILHRRECIGIAALQLDTHRKIVASSSTSENRYAGVPGASIG